MEVKTTAPATTPRWGRSAPRFARGPAGARKFQMFLGRYSSMLAGKDRMVIIEDFSGTGTDLSNSLAVIKASSLPLTDILLAPVSATQMAMDRLRRSCALASGAPSAVSRSYSVVTAEELPHSLCCFDGPDPSYLDDQDLIPTLSAVVRRLSEEMYTRHFSRAGADLLPRDMHGFGHLALAFVLYTNCPDNSLPLLWKEVASFPVALFRRVSRVI